MRHYIVTMKSGDHTEQLDAIGEDATDATGWAVVTAWDRFKKWMNIASVEELPDPLWDSRLMGAGGVL
jgi:hypothetical protein